MDVKGVQIAFLGHSGFLITNGGGKRIAIDPYMVAESVAPVDLILITHSHYDHCSIKDIMRLARKGTSIVVPADAQSKIAHIDGVNMQIIEVGDELAFGSLKIEALPAYNIKKDFHPKSEGWLGYILKFDGVVIYHAGDSDKIPEMEKLTGYGKHDNIFITLLPVSGTYVMTAEEAAEVASLLNPSYAIPMHYGSGVVGMREDAERFVKLCDALNVKAELLEKVA